MTGEHPGADSQDVRNILEMLQRWSYILDDAIRIPGTNVRFGWDPIIGLVPWLGDVLTGLFSVMIVFHSFRLGIPRVVKIRMLINILIDVVVGTIPILGDAFDFAWKANRRNMELVEKYALTAKPASAGDWMFVAGAGLLFLIVVSLPFLLLWLLLSALSHTRIFPI